jgi:hypothetical protein
VQRCHEPRELRLVDACTTCFNRAVARLPLSREEADYAALQRVMLGACERRPTRILARCLMRNPRHFVICPREEGQKNQRRCRFATTSGGSDKKTRFVA